MVSLKQRQSGFTIVELLIVIVIIGILAGLVITTFTGIQQRARNAERQTDLRALSSQLESYYTTNGQYPTLANINSATWRAGNKFNAGDSGKAMFDPMNTSAAIGGTTVTAATTAYLYNYVTVPAVCTAVTDDTATIIASATPCTGFVLSAHQENTTAPLTIKSSN